MTEEMNGIEPLKESKYRATHFEWVLPTFLRPRHILREISQQERAVWLVPLLLLTALALLNVVVGGPVRADSTQSMTLSPETMQYYTPEQLAQFEQSANQSKGPLFIYVFPSVNATLGIWVSWLLLAGLLHFVLTLSGSRSSSIVTLNLTAWASLPLGLRSFIQAIYTLFTHHVVHNQGLSGFVSANAKGMEIYWGAILGQIDIYLIWQVILLLIGIKISSKLAPGKALVATMASVLLIMAISALPAFVGSQLGGLSGGGYIPFL
jgi:hypothetical protein